MGHRPEQAANEMTSHATLQVLLFGGTGMVGAAVLDQCLADDRVTHVLAVGRTPTGRTHPKLSELAHADLFDISPIADQLRGYDACFFTVGVSAADLKEPEYTRTTYDLTLAVARTMRAIAPEIAFLYVSGAGTDSSEKGRFMWARVKGRTENALLAMGFKRAVMVRLGGLIPLKGLKSKTRLYRITYAIMRPILPIGHMLMPGVVTTPRLLGRAMIAAALGETDKQILSGKDIHQLGQ